MYKVYVYPWTPGCLLEQLLNDLFCQLRPWAGKLVLTVFSLMFETLLPR